MPMMGKTFPYRPKRRSHWACLCSNCSAYGRCISWQPPQILRLGQGAKGAPFTADHRLLSPKNAQGAASGGGRRKVIRSPVAGWSKASSADQRAMGPPSEASGLQ